MSSQTSEGGTEGIQPYSMHVSARYLDLTRRKLELTRLPRESPLPDFDRWRYGVPKTLLEPLIDFWLEQYDWRAQEATLNNRLPQFRATVAIPDLNKIGDEPNKSFRIHFVHKRCQQRNAVPLLFCHGWPGNFLEVYKIIDNLTEPDLSALPPGTRVPLAFHVVAPSIPGFGFSDASADDGFGLEDTADAFDALMKQLGYHHYVAHGSEWGFKICRLLSLRHQSSCTAIHTISPNFPAPNFRTSFLGAVKYHIARLSNARLTRLSFGYIPSETLQQQHDESVTTQPNLEAMAAKFASRPQSLSYSLCDSPVGLLASLLDILQPSTLKIPPKPKSNSPRLGENSRRVNTGRLMESIPEATTSTDSISPPPGWTPSDILDWTMIHWLPGPEAGLRWLHQAQREEALGANGIIWKKWSTTPLGISTFRIPSRSNSTEMGQAPAPNGHLSDMEGVTDSPSGPQQHSWFYQSFQSLNRWLSAAGLQQQSSAPAEASMSSTSSPPMWASTYQNLEWVRRHETAARMPVWEIPDQVVVDIRDCFADFIERKLVSLSYD